MAFRQNKSKAFILEVTQELRRAKKRHFVAQEEQAQATDLQMRLFVQSMLAEHRAERKAEAKHSSEDKKSGDKHDGFG